MKYVIDTFNQCSLHAPDKHILKIYEDVPETMEYDNRGYLINRPLFSHSSLPDSLGLERIHVGDFNFNEEFVYCVYVHHNQLLWSKYIHKIPDYVLDSVKIGKCKLIFDNTLEGDACDEFFPIIYNSIDELELPPDRLHFITNNLLAEKTHSEFIKKQHRSEYMNVVSFMWNVYDVKRLKDVNLPHNVNINDELKYKKENINNIKHFMKVNRTNREERNLFMLFMNKHNLINKSLISFPSFPDLEYWGMFPYLTTKENINSLKSKVPIDIDYTDETNHGEPGIGLNKFDADLPFQSIHYKNSFISIVMCAFPFVENACHLHSSTYNPMYCGHPVIQFGPYQHLKEMRKRGFKTFSNWWDESYDDEPNHWERFKMVMDITLNISKMKVNEVYNMIYDMRDVLQHNSDLINNYDIKTELYNKIFDE